MTEAALCGAKRRKGGGTCRRPAGWGTDHTGVGTCKLHGGSTRNHAKSAAKAQAATLAAELEMEPHDALLWCVRAAAGEVSYCTSRVAELREEELVVEHLKERETSGDGDSYVERTNAAELHIWVRARQEALDRLARYSKMALDAGVAERAVRIAERMGDELVTLIGGILAELELTVAQQQAAPQVVRKHLTLLEGGAPRVAA